MIYESSFWKNDLLKQANLIRRRIAQKHWTDISFARFEQGVMLGFYSIRKLIEAKRLSDKIRQQSLKIVSHPWKGKLVTQRNWPFIDELYELDVARPISKSLTFICNQFIHSYVFMTSFNQTKNLDGVFVSSDEERNKALYFLNVRQIIGLFEQIGNDYPTTVEMKFNPKKQDYDVSSW